MVKRVDSKSLLRHKLSMKSSLFVGLFQFPRPVQWRIGKKRRIMRWQFIRLGKKQEKNSELCIPLTKESGQAPPRDIGITRRKPRSIKRKPISKKGRYFFSFRTALNYQTIMGFKAVAIGVHLFSEISSMHFRFSIDRVQRAFHKKAAGSLIIQIKEPFIFRFEIIKYATRLNKKENRMSVM